MQDDVVPFKTIVDLMEQLMVLGKDFDIAIAPAATHGWAQREHYATFMYRRIVNHFDRYLGNPAASGHGGRHSMTRKTSSEARSQKSERGARAYSFTTGPLP